MVTLLTVSLHEVVVNNSWVDAAGHLYYKNALMKYCKLVVQLGPFQSPSPGLRDYID